MNVFTDIRSRLQFCMLSENPRAEHILKNGIPEYDLIKWCEQFLTPSGIFVDVGAHMGTYTILLSKKCKEVYSFEPQKNTFDGLSIGICVNNCFNIKHHNCALGSSEGAQTLYQVSKDGSDSTLCAEIPELSGQKVLQTELSIVKTLDSYGLENVQFLKIAVEGSELEVIKGASLTLLNNNFPPFIFKVYAQDWYKSQKELILAHVRALGYKVDEVSGSTDLFLAAEHPLSVNKTVPKSAEELKYDTPALVKRYQDKELQADPEVTWDTWHHLARHFRCQSKHQNAYDCATRGLKLSPPLDQEYKLYEEIAIVAYYIDKKQEGYEACDKVIFSHSASWQTQNYTLNNQSFYMSKIPFKNIYALKHEIPEYYTGSSVSLIPKDNGEFLANMRAVNYHLTEKGEFISRHSDGVIRTRNYLLALDKDMKIKSGKELVDNSGIELYPQNVCGFEDTRLFGTNELFTACFQIEKNRICLMCYCRYDPVTAEITSVKPLMVGTEHKNEKNWLPFIMNDEVHFIYSISPLRLYKLNRETGETILVKEERLSPQCLDSFRGSANPIPYKGGWLCTCHQVYHAWPRRYFHRFIWFDKDFTTLKYSDVFYFESVEVEYNLSICPTDDSLLVCYSHHESSSKIGCLNYELLDSWLKL